MQNYVPCPICGEEVTKDSDFCPHCGVVYAESEPVQCEDHPDRKGESLCIICHRVLCKECTRSREGRRFCQDHKSVNVEQDWAQIYQSSEINEAGLVKSVLENAEFHVQVQNFNSIGFVWDGGGDSAQSRSNIGKPAKVFVPIPEYLNAEVALREWESGEVKEEN